MNATQTSTSHCQVLIVGAGPTGLVLAAQLLSRGVRTRIIDKREGPAPQSRAVSIQARTLEFLDTMGLADAFIAHGHQVRRFHWYAGQRSLSTSMWHGTAHGTASSSIFRRTKPSGYCEHRYAILAARPNRASS